MTSSAINIFRTANKILRCSTTISQNVLEGYKSNLLNQKKKMQILVNEKFEKVAKSELANKMRIARQYYTLEMSPPSINEAQKLKDDIVLIKEFMQTGCYKFLTVKQAWLLFLVGLEVALWFFLGETFGKCSIVGYKV